MIQCSDDELRELNDRVEGLKNQYSHMSISCDYLKDATLMSRSEKKSWFQNRPYCSGGHWAMVVLPDGQCTVCEELYYNPTFLIGDLKKESILEVWNGEKLKTLIYPRREEFRGSPCFACKDFESCHANKGRCWKRALKAHSRKKNAEHWPDPYCPSSVREERII
jgi:radical SAM protein with 4Fe4S-binding SPASM domain